MLVGYELTGLELDQTGSTRAAERTLRELGGREDVEVVELRHPGGPGTRLLRGLARELRYLPLTLPREARARGVELLHCPVPLAPLRCPVPLVVTVNDALPWEHPEWLTRANALQMRLVMARVLRRAEAVIVPSEHSRERLVELVGLDPERLVTVPYGIDERFRPGERPHELLERLGVRGDYVLAVGTLQPRKNLGRLVEAFERLDPQADLLIVGARGWSDEALVRRIAHSPLAGRIHLTGRVSDHELVGLYSGATVFAFPSLYEGFGFPLLEAMACGAPVVSSDRTSLPELAGDAALTVDAGDPAALAAALGELLASPERRSELAERGVRRARAFTWGRTADGVVSAYRSALSRARAARQ